MARDICNSDKLIDSRDVIARIAELQTEKERLRSAVTEAQADYAAADKEWGGMVDGEERETLEAELDDLNEILIEAQAALKEWEGDDEAGDDPSDDAQELKHLLALADDAEGYSDWKYGATLIHDAYFEDYAEELASDIGAIDRNAVWPLSHIDWKSAADELKVDYTSVDFDGQTYWVR